ncbi:unnamed protein product, partial [Heterotrigona itama]
RVSVERRNKPKLRLPDFLTKDPTSCSVLTAETSSTRSVRFITDRRAYRGNRSFRFAKLLSNGEGLAPLSVHRFNWKLFRKLPKVRSKSSL